MRQIECESGCGAIVTTDEGYAYCGECDDDRDYAEDAANRAHMQSEHAA